MSARCNVSAPLGAQQRGAASLIVVMVLFFLLSMVAAYTSRNLIFEHRTSINQYRATQAFEAAEAGLEWALSMLNGGRIGADCTEGSATSASTSFRQRYLRIDATSGMITPATGAAVGDRMWPSCVSDGAGGWSCNCPTDALPVLPAAGDGRIYPAFRVRFTNAGINRPGVVRIESNGCTRLANDCLDHPGSAHEMEGRANLAVMVALTSALPVPPVAALTALGDVTGGGALSVYNTDADIGGITIQAGGNLVNPAPPLVLRSVPGTPGLASVAAGDTGLAALAAAPDRAFASVFGMWPQTYRLQPAAIQFNCATGGCRSALSELVSKNPDRVIWVSGDLTLESSGDVGSPPDPLDPTAAGPTLIIVNGQVNFLSSGVRVHGLIYSRGGAWSGSGQVLGGAFVEGTLAGTAAATIAMDKATLTSLRLRSGSFVRVPGSWDDFREARP